VPTRIRSLSPTERVWLVADRLGAPFVLTAVVEGREMPSRDRLQEAAALAAQANPGARARLQGVLGGARWVDSGEPPAVLEGEALRPGPVLDERLLEEGPGLELRLAPGQLAVRVHHALMDGRGLWHFLEETFRALRGEQPLGGDDRLTDRGLVGGGMAKLPPEQDLAATGSHRGGTWPVWGRRRVQGRWSSLLGHLGVAVAEHARSFGSGSVGLQVPVDLREGQRSTSNLTGLLRLEASPEDDPESLTRQLSERRAKGEPQAWVRAAKPVAGMPLWLLTALGRPKARRAIEASRFGGTAVLSNLGRVDRSLLQAPGFELDAAYWIPPCGPSTAAFIGLLGDAQGVEIVAVLPEGLASEGRLEGLLGALVTGLESVRER
jgi:hypothetical protein